MKELAVTIFVIALSLTCSGQCRYLTEQEKLDATCAEHIRRCGTFGEETVSVSIVIRKNRSGYAILSRESEFRTCFEGFGGYFGDSYFYLDDETIIKLINRGSQWSVNGECFVRYNLTPAELNLLSKSNIRSVRYSTQSVPAVGEATNEDCKDRYGPSARIDFPALIVELLGK